MIRRAVGVLADSILRAQNSLIPITSWLPRFYQVKPLIDRHKPYTLDAACGTGELTLWMANQGMKVAGVNLSKHEIDVARQRASEKNLDIDFRVGDLAEHTTFEDESFDQIVSLDTIVHIPDDNAVFSEFHRLLKPGGQLLASLASFAPSGSGSLFSAQRAFHRRIPRILEEDPVWQGKTWLRCSSEDLQARFGQFRFYELLPLLKKLADRFELSHYEYGLRLFSALATDVAFGIRYGRYFQPFLFTIGTRLDRLFCHARRPGYVLLVTLKKK